MRSSWVSFRDEPPRVEFPRPAGLGSNLSDIILDATSRRRHSCARSPVAEFVRIPLWARSEFLRIPLRLRAGDVGYRGVGEQESVGDAGLVVGQELREAHAGQNLDTEDLLHAGLELEEAERLAIARIDDPDAAAALVGGEALGDGDAAEGGAVAHLREADKGERAVEVEAAGEARKLRDRLELAGGGVDEGEGAGAGLE